MKSKIILISSIVANIIFITIILCNKFLDSEIIQSVIIGISTGFLTGAASGYMVTKIYRKIDFNKQKKRYFDSIINHVVHIKHLISEFNKDNSNYNLDILYNSIKNPPINLKEYGAKEWEGVEPDIMQSFDIFAESTLGSIKEYKNFLNGKYPKENEDDFMHEQRRLKYVREIHKELNNWQDLINTHMKYKYNSDK